MKSLMILASVLIAGALMATAGSPTSCTNNAFNTQLGCSGSGTNQFFTECGKSCTNKFSISLMAKTLGCTNQVTAGKI